MNVHLRDQVNELTRNLQDLIKKVFSGHLVSFFKELETRKATLL